MTHHEKQPPSMTNNTLISSGSDPVLIHSLSQSVKLSNTHSQVFDAPHSLNPLAAAAAPLLTTINKILPQIKQVRPNDLYQLFIHEIQVFEDKAQQLEYRSAIILAARYFLCAYIDEMMENSTPPLVQDFWKKHRLLNKIQGETWGGERFFIILERASEDPKNHIHLLELGFLCLNLGYQGQYKNSRNHEEALENIRENLFELIKKVRGNYSSTLYYKAPNKPQTTKPVVKAKPARRFPHLLVAGALLVIGLASVYLPYQRHLSALTQQVGQSLQTLGNLPLEQ